MFFRSTGAAQLMGKPLCDKSAPPYECADKLFLDHQFLTRFPLLATMRALDQNVPTLPGPQQASAP
jgi:hypothetical protein